MAVNSAFANGFGAAPAVGLLGTWPPDPTQLLSAGLLPSRPPPQQRLGVLGIPCDPASLFGSPFDPSQLAGAGPEGGGDLGALAAQVRALQAVRDHLSVAAGWLGQLPGQGGPAPDASGGHAPVVQPPLPPITASTAKPVTAMAPTGALRPFDPSGGFTPDRTFTVGDGDANGTLIGIARQLYPDNPLAGVGLLARANRLQGNAQNSPILVPGQALTAPTLSGDAASLAASEHDGRSVLAANDLGLQSLAAQRAAGTRQTLPEPDTFTRRLISGQNVWTGQPIEPSQGGFANSQAPGSFDRLGAILAAPPLPPRPRIETLGGNQYADIPDAAGDHLYPVEGYRSDGQPMLSGGAFLVPPDPVGEAKARRSAAWLQATDRMADNPGATLGLVIAGAAGADEPTQLHSIDLGDALGGLVLASGTPGGESPGLLNTAAPRFSATPSAEIRAFSQSPEREDPGGAGGSPDSPAPENPGTTGALPDDPEPENSEGVEPTQGDIERINGRMPINSKYAGKVFPLDELTPGLKAKHPDIHLKYPDSVQFIPKGHPDFLPYAMAGFTRDDLTGNYTIDRRIANMYGFSGAKPSDYVWHHVEDGKTMLLIPADLHDAVRHTGGVAVLKQANRK